MADDNTIKGWTFEQWALAAGRYPGHEPTLAGAIKLSWRWRSHARSDPGEMVIAGVEYPADYDWAEQMFTTVQYEAPTRLFA